ncbi:fasciclin domain-containing protein [Variovorax dokdonensis]|uniref:Fasciclin domain-containing protein n=1 Tax=Variovorax dokdonensis TaxID=344883 RepID=A0ABT7NC85_9BURK|nr:fasciclin domain-containing protein [Variovorax dokdonensis]MDM0045532.1 fasciclin domain-containing protein [Variovorax dokdonensis]
MQNATAPFKRRRQVLLSFAAFGGAALLQACGGGGGDSISSEINDRKNLMQLSESKPELSVWVEAINTAGLRERLSQSGSNTAFAPTNDAFNALLGELGVSKDQLFADKQTLTAVLNFHILGKTMLRETIPEGEAIEPIGGGFFKIDDVGNNTLQFTDGRSRTGRVISTDSLAANGVLHTLDRVMLPENKNISQTAATNSELTSFTAALAAAGMTQTLEGAGPFTVLAPSNAAFAALLVELNLTEAAMLADTENLKKILSYHVLQARLTKVELRRDSSRTTLQGGVVRISDSYQITDVKNRVANITTPDVFNTNGVIHIIDKVLLPA